ncbi:expressed unknown protein [Seminavis robusta]|uniref:Knr4/Smi1-like domain-containing protein n=1 Tax=Seminavis robusta TaxID=568900 RepID=A0A9N8F441_9STRA|nr:expressed unknown protein [Seminavis robusta]|eukprot:Sro2864_g338900.1 n/a (295) ;mRNA; f:6202-7086
MPQRVARTYEEAALKPEVMQRGIDLVAPLARILLRRSETVKEFQGCTTDAEWEAFEKEFNITIPADFKLLTNTVGTTGSWLNDTCRLTTPKDMAKSIKELQERYHTSLLEEPHSQYQNVGVWPQQHAFHLEWGLDEHGNALSHFWCCAKSDKGSAWPVVALDLEANLQYNGSLHICTVTEALYRDVIDKKGMADYFEQEEDEDDEDDQEIEGIMMTERRVYKFVKHANAAKSKIKTISDFGDIGEVDSEQDKKDMAMLDDVDDLEIIDGPDVKTKCTIMAPVDAEPEKKKQRQS